MGISVKWVFIWGTPGTGGGLCPGALVRPRVGGVYGFSSNRHQGRVVVVFWRFLAWKCGFNCMCVKMTIASFVNPFRIVL